MTSIFYSQKQPHRLSAIKTEEDVVIPSAVDETSFPLLWTDLDPDDKELPSVHVIFLEESMSLVQLSIKPFAFSSRPALLRQTFVQNRHFVQELLLHLILAEETQAFHINDGLVIVEHQASTAGIGWWLKVKREPWELGGLLDFAYVPSSTLSSAGKKEKRKREEGRARDEAPLFPWVDKLEFTFGLDGDDARST